MTRQFSKPLITTASASRSRIWSSTIAILISRSTIVYFLVGNRQVYYCSVPDCAVNIEIRADHSGPPGHIDDTRCPAIADAQHIEPLSIIGDGKRQVVVH